MSQEPELDTESGILQYIRKATRLSGAIVLAQSGDSDALEDLQEPRTIRLAFPGSRNLAEGGALKYVEDLDELGISAEHEYVSDEGDFHRINILIEGGE